MISGTQVTSFALRTHRGLGKEKEDRKEGRKNSWKNTVIIKGETTGVLPTAVAAGTERRE